MEIRLRSVSALTHLSRDGRDATAWNWRRKKRIYAKSRLYVATPCKWLMEKVKDSMLSQAIQEARVIPYGTDLSVFKPGSKVDSRVLFDLPLEADFLIFTANGIRKNIFKDYRARRSAIAACRTPIATAFSVRRAWRGCAGRAHWGSGNPLCAISEGRCSRGALLSSRRYLYSFSPGRYVPKHSS